jgi:MoaA/NifB/PqqE/SkfB family radical SAM enzyme
LRVVLEWISEKLEELSSPELDWVQVEVTTHCSGSCLYCPRGVLKSAWRSRHMPIALFRKLLPSLRNTELVFLQGWGEPLLHPDLFDMVRLCKERGKRVGFTTNGMLLNDENLSRLVDLELDILAVSLAGTKAGTHDRLRKGTDFRKIVSSLDLLGRLKARGAIGKPALHLAWLMLVSNFHEIEDIVALAGDVGASQVVAGNLTLILDDALHSEALFNDPAGTRRYEETLDRIGQDAASRGILFDYHGPGLARDRVGCRENVPRACVVGVDGDVVPCVFTDPALGADTGPLQYRYEEGWYALSPMAFGNLRGKSLSKIHGSAAYRRFRKLFDSGASAKPDVMRSMPACCVRCYKRLGA